MMYSGGRKEEQALTCGISEEQKDKWARKYTLRRNGTQYFRFKIELTFQGLARVSEEEKKREKGMRSSLSQLIFPSLHWLSQNCKHFK